VENAELEVALEELESRLERLRALYEQYFMGIERIEPAIPRKDIDRRIYVLRREKIRNTAKRFKLQTIISRYNTFQQYWQRICREIENGTYKRHVIKAERIAPGQILTIAARKRLGRAALQAMEPDEGVAPNAPPSELPAAPPVAAPAPAAPGVRLAPPPKPGAAPPPKPGAAPAAKPALPTRPAPPPKPGARPAPAGAPAAAAPAAKNNFETLDLDMDFLGDWDPSAAARGPAGKRAPEVPARPFGKPLAKPMGTPPAPPVGAKPAKLPSVKPTRPGMGTDGSAAPRPAAPPPAPPPKPVTIPPRPATTPMVSKPLAPRPPAPPPAAAKPLAPIIPGTTPAKPSPAKPVAPPAATAPAADERVRELHARLVEAKRQTQDGTAVSMEGLAKSMKATEAKLREQHKNRKIDFDVVIKDGKAVLKPIVR